MEEARHILESRVDARLQRKKKALRPFFYLRRDRWQKSQHVDSVCKGDCDLLPDTGGGDLKDSGNALNNRKRKLPCGGGVGLKNASLK